MFLFFLYRALEASLLSGGAYSGPRNGEPVNNVPPELEDESLSLALQLSKEDAWRRDQELRREQEMIEEAIRLSLQEK